jgi:hypothetical protein
MNKLISLIFFSIVVWQIVSSIIQATNKKQGQMKSKYASRQQAAQRGPGGAPTGQPGRTRTQAQTLADRRRAQLEELRARRAGKAQGGGPTEVRLSSPRPKARPQPPAPVAKPRREIEALGAGLKKLRAAQEAEARKKTADRRTHDAAGQRQATREDARNAKARQEQLRKKQQAKRDAAKPAAGGPRRVVPEFEKAEIAARDVHEDAYALDLEARHRARTVGPLVAKLNDRSTLRQLFILKELIEPPLALRRTTEG